MKPAPAPYCGAFVFALATLTHLWVLDVPFKVDDLTQIPAARAKLHGELGAAGPLLVSADPDLPTHVPDEEAFRFRPLLWTTFLVEDGLYGRPWNPRAFHLTSLLLHGICAVLVLVLFRRLLDPGPALLGAVFFACWPHATQAVSWIAARGDLLVTLFGVWGAVVALGGKGGAGWGRALAAGTLAAAGLLAKVSALPVAVLVAAVVTWRARRRLAALGACLLPVAAVVLWRQLILHSSTFDYRFGINAGPADLPRIAGSLVPFTSHVMVPWVLAPEVDGQPALRGWLGTWDHATARLLVAGVLVAIPFAAALAAPRRALPRALAAAAAFVLLALPPLVIFVPNQDNGFNRAFHVLAVPVAFVMGTAAMAFTDAATGRVRGRVRWGLLVAWLVIAAAVATDAWIQIVNVERHAAELVERRQRSVRAAIQDDPPDTVWFTTGLSTFHGGIPLAGNALPWSFARPFCNDPRTLVYVPSEDALLDSHAFHTTTQAVGVLTWEGDTARVSMRLPARDGSPPQLSEIDARRGETAAWAPRSTCVPRALRALAWEFPAGPVTPGACVLQTDRGELEQPFTLPASDAPRTVVVVVDRAPAWMLASTVKRVAMRGIRPRSGPRFLEKVPVLEVASPAEGAERTAGAPLELAFPEGTAPLHLRARFTLVAGGLKPVSLVYRAPPGAFRHENGRAVYRVRPGDWAGGDIPWLRLHRLGELLERTVGKGVIDRVLCTVHLEATDATGRTVHARARPLRLTLVTRR